MGRYKLNRRLGLDTPLEDRILTNEDLIAVIKRIIQINNGEGRADDIDHLGNRRIKTVGELIQNQLRIGLLRMERVVRERMSIRDPDQVTPLSLASTSARSSPPPASSSAAPARASSWTRPTRWPS